MLCLIYNLNFFFKMNINDCSVLEMINSLIASERLNNNQILQIVDLASISNNLKELKENIKWETYKSRIK